MRFKFLGTRGSYPSQKEEHLSYGGNTSCVEISNDQHRLILDAGTGILDLDLELYTNSSRIDILLTHLHMDHIQGLAFFKPLFKKEIEVHIWGPGGATEDLRSHLNRYFSPPLFPVPLRELPCQLHLHEIANSSFTIESFEITSAFVIHPGPTLGYQIKNDSKIIAYIPDHEPMVGSTELYKKDKWVSGLSLCKNADVLIHDSMYTEEEYLRKVGWGHSSTEHVVQMARRAGVKKLFLFHHNPEYSDAFLEQRLKSIKQNQEVTFDILLANEGVEYEL